MNHEVVYLGDKLYLRLRMVEVVGTLDAPAGRQGNLKVRRPVLGRIDRCTDLGIDSFDVCFADTVSNPERNQPRTGAWVAAFRWW